MKTQAQLKIEIENAKALVTVGAVYAHYKDPSHTYKVIDLAVNTDDSTVWVIYQALYEEKLTFLRSIDEWVGKVQKDGRLIKRFTLIEN